AGRAAARGGRRRPVARRIRAPLPRHPGSSRAGRRGLRVIDTHCHLLHSLDDGPKTERDSGELARQLARAGVRAVVCTPHFSRRFRTELRPALVRITELERLLLEAPIALALSLAAEVSPAFAVSEPMEELLQRSMGGRFLLVELEPDTPAAFLEPAAARLAGARRGPRFAHPERLRRG